MKLDVPSATPFARFARGLAYPFRGAHLVYVRRPGLIKYWGPAIALVLIIASVAFYFAVAYHDDALRWVLPPPSGPGRLQRAGYVALDLVVLVIFAALSLVTVLMFSNVIASPFNDLLSEAIERDLLGTPEQPFSLQKAIRDAVRSIRLEVTKLLLYLLIMAPLFVLAVVLPVVGPALHVTFGALFTSLYLAVDYIDWPATRRNIGVVARGGLLREYFPEMLGFGAAVWFLVFIPCLSLFLMPAAVAGGTMLFVEVILKDRVATD